MELGSDLAESLKCPVCFDLIEDAVMYPCSHNVCKSYAEKSPASPPLGPRTVSPSGSKKPGETAAPSFRESDEPMRPLEPCGSTVEGQPAGLT